MEQSNIVPYMLLLDSESDRDILEKIQSVRNVNDYLKALVRKDEILAKNAARAERRPGRTVIDLTGQRFGNWVVIERDRSKDAVGKTVWKCKCDCGNIGYVNSQNLRNGTSKGCMQCGALKRRRYSSDIPDSGKQATTRKKMLNTWHNLINRCNNPDNIHFIDYGGRGITVCSEWESDFSAFYDYVSQLDHFSEPGFSLDRIDNEQGYQPGNVRWATMIEQSNNRRERYDAKE